jgi:hypothetical protein
MYCVYFGGPAESASVRKHPRAAESMRPHPHTCAAQRSVLSARRLASDERPRNTRAPRWQGRRPRQRLQRGLAT